MIREEPIDLSFCYAAGKAASQFFKALRDEGKILGSPCRSCGRVLCPPRSFCPECGEPTDELKEVGPEGDLISWTSSSDGEVFGLIKLDGADTAILHRLLDGETSWSKGDRVQIRLADGEKLNINLIEGFNKIEEGGK